MNFENILCLSGQKPRLWKGAKSSPDRNWKMPANPEPLNRIEIFWYHFTPRNISYLMVLLNLVKFGTLGRSAPQDWKLCMFSSISMLNSVVFNALQCFLNLLSHYKVCQIIKNIRVWGKTKCLPSRGMGGGGGGASAPLPSPRVDASALNESRWGNPF